MIHEKKKKIVYAEFVSKIWKEKNDDGMKSIR